MCKPASARRHQAGKEHLMRTPDLAERVASLEKLVDDLAERVASLEKLVDELCSLAIIEDLIVRSSSEAAACRREAVIRLAGRRGR